MLFIQRNYYSKYDLADLHPRRCRSVAQTYYLDHVSERPPKKKKIPDFDNYLLTKEGNGILRWANGGAQFLLEADKQLIKSDAQKAKIEQLLNESDSLCNFIDHVIIADSNSTATTAELIEAYKRFCERKNWTPVSRCFAERMLPELMFMRFGVSKRTDVMRNGKNNRGYYGFAINQ